MEARTLPLLPVGSIADGRAKALELATHDLRMKEGVMGPIYWITEVSSVEPLRSRMLARKAVYQSHVM